MLKKSGITLKEVCSENVSCPNNFSLCGAKIITLNHVEKGITVKEMYSYYVTRAN
jgi:hypothetical protein